MVYGSSWARSPLGAAAAAAAYATATATLDLSYICNLCHSLQQHRILNSLSKARDQTYIFTENAGSLTWWATMGTSIYFFFFALNFKKISLFLVDGLVEVKQTRVIHLTLITKLLIFLVLSLLYIRGWRELKLFFGKKLSVHLQLHWRVKISIQSSLSICWGYWDCPWLQKSMDT